MFCAAWWKTKRPYERGEIRIPRGLADSAAKRLPKARRWKRRKLQRTDLLSGAANKFNEGIPAGCRKGTPVLAAQKRSEIKRVHQRKLAIGCCEAAFHFGFIIVRGMVDIKG